MPLATPAEVCPLCSAHPSLREEYATFLGAVELLVRVLAFLDGLRLDRKLRFSIIGPEGFWIRAAASAGIWAANTLGLPERSKFLW